MVCRVHTPVPVSVVCGSASPLASSLASLVGLSSVRSVCLLPRLALTSYWHLHGGTQMALNSAGSNWFTGAAFPSGRGAQALVISSNVTTQSSQKLDKKLWWSQPKEKHPPMQTTFGL